MQTKYCTIPAGDKLSFQGLLHLKRLLSAHVMSLEFADWVYLQRSFNFFTSSIYLRSLVVSTKVNDLKPHK